MNGAADGRNEYTSGWIDGWMTDGFMGYHLMDGGFDEQIEEW